MAERESVVARDAASRATDSVEPTVSIIVPCRNEARFIRHCLDSILSSDFPADEIEVLVVDGMSDDGTREIVAEVARHHHAVRLIDNPKQITPVAFNLGVTSARGSLIMLMSAHATYEKSAIRQLVSSSRAHNAENVGGIWKVYPRTDTFLSRAVARTLSHPFGVGGSAYRTTLRDAPPRWADTAAYGCYQRQVFSRIGLFNEQLRHGQDMEFNLRLKKAGGRTLLVPSAVINYFARTDVKAFMKHNWRNGLWVILPFRYSLVMPVAWRHLVPMAFVLCLMGSAGLAVLVPALWKVFYGMVLSYAALSALAAAQIAWRERDARYGPVMPILFLLLHVGYGLGSVWGVIRLLPSPAFWNNVKARLGQSGQSNEF